MAGTARGGLRPHHPSKHSFILVGLVIVVIVLGINYWSTSAKNSRLLAELAKVQKNYKVMPSVLPIGAASRGLRGPTFFGQARPGPAWPF